MDEFSQYAVEEDEFSKYEEKPKVQEDEFSQYAADEDEFSQYATDKQVDLTPESPTLISEPLTKDEITKIAAKHGVTNPDVLDKLITQAYIRGGTVEGETRPLQYAVGLASDLILPGEVPSFIQKKLQDDPKLRAAMDDVSTLVDAKQSTARAIGEIAGGLVVPGLGTASLAAKSTKVLGKIGGAAAVGATYGGVGGLAGSKEGEELEGAAVGAGFGAALGGALGGAGGWITNRQAKKAEAAVERLKTGDTEFDNRIVPEMKRMVDSSLDPTVEAKVIEPLVGDVSPEDYQKLLNEKRELVAYIHSGDVEKVKQMNPEQLDANIGAAIHNHGVGHVTQMYREAVLNKVAKEFENRVQVERLDKISRGVAAPFRAVEAAMYMADRLDKATGSNFNKYINNISMKLNEYKNTTREATEQVKDLVTATRAEATRLNVPYEEVNRALYETLDGATPALQVDPKLVNGWRDMWESFRQLNNKVEGEEVIKRWGGEEGMYVPHSVTDATEAVEKIQRKIFELVDTEPKFKEAMENIGKGRNVNLEEFISTLPQKAQEDVQDLAKSVYMINDRDTIVNTFNDLIKIFNNAAEKPPQDIRLGEMAARASKSRTGGTPNLIRERDLAKLAERYITNTLKQAYIGKEATAMKGEIMALLKAGVDKEMVEDMSKLWQDITIGHRGDTVAGKLNQSVREFTTKARRDAIIAEREGKKLKAKQLRLMSQAPGALKFLGDQIYPSTLGIFTNQRSPIKNMFQLFMQTSPEVGYRYAIPEVMRSLKYGVRNIANGKLEKELAADGLFGEQWSDIDFSRLMSQDSPKAVRAFLDANHKVANVAMTPFSKSEVLLRYAATRLGHKAGNDMVAAMVNPGKLDFNQTSAMTFLKNLTDADRRAAEGLLKQAAKEGPEAAKSKKQLQVLLSQAIIQRTVFDYNKGNASIIARNLPAPLLVFTKFPTYIASDILNRMQRADTKTDAALDLTRTYLAPYALMSLADNVSEEVWNDDENLVKLVLGRSGLEGVTGLSALGGLGIFGSPLISAPFQAGISTLAAGKELLGGDVEEAGKQIKAAGKGAASTASLYTPIMIGAPARALYKIMADQDD